jgi:hypothetical protein
MPGPEKFGIRVTNDQRGDATENPHQDYFTYSSLSAARYLLSPACAEKLPERGKSKKIVKKN